MPDDAPGKLSADQIAALQKDAAKFSAAQKQVTDAVHALWSAQVDMAIKMGNAEQIHAVMRRPVEFYDNCSCGGGGTGTASW